MDIAFVGEKDIFIFIYLDDMIVLSMKNEEHVEHLNNFFVKCRNLSLSLNLRKSYVAMTKGNYFGHIVSKEGVKIDLERV